ncbi:MAG: mannose-1-phosphate guanylyltransferase/mannose-6-phosphate isomerase, partial [Rhodospirillaceae bacterium]|nr:mannose-1-phosphate guanylyltransferase/mannose-6-phosphate isomerase [Rhodospirillaceae bacterium]
HAVRPTVPVILAGSDGTRLWPLSRAAMPKQFQPLTDRLTPYQKALTLVSGGPYASPIIVTTATYLDLARVQAKAVGVTDPLFVVEPAGRNSAPSILAAAILCTRRHSASDLLVLPSDHHLNGDDRFQRSIDTARELVATADMLIAFGIHPTNPETGGRYIRAGAPMVVPGARLIDQFLEKQSRSQAEALLGDEDVLWNSGLFYFPTERLLEEAARLQPAMLTAVNYAAETARLSGPVVHLDEATYAKAQSLPIDIAVMERTDCAAVVPMTADWNDICTYSDLWDIAEERDTNGNVTLGTVVTEQTSNSYLRSDGRLTAVVGLDNVVVISTDDAVLVADRSETQAIRPLVERLAAEGAKEVERPPTAVHHWGTHRTVDRGIGYQVNHIMVMPGERLSLHYHHYRSEHWTVVSGVARVIVDDREHDVRPNQTVYVPLGAVHQIENRARVGLHLIEVQCGGYLGEDDVVLLDEVDHAAGGLPDFARAAE